MIVNASARSFDGLRFAAQLRSDEATRHLPILAIVDWRRAAPAGQGAGDRRQRHPGQADRPAGTGRPRAHPDPRKRYTDYLRDNLDHSLELAVTDQLTGLHNRRYMTGQLEALVRRASPRRRAGGLSC